MLRWGGGAGATARLLTYSVGASGGWRCTHHGAECSVAGDLVVARPTEEAGAVMSAIELSMLSSSAKIWKMSLLPRSCFVM